MLVAFHLHRRPLSVNASLSRGYKQAIGEAARRHYDGPPVATSALHSRIIWFHKYRSPQGDTDNIAKKIHDALKEVVFVDDRVITHTMTVRVDATEGVELAPNPHSPSGAAALAQSIDDPAVKDVLYIEIGLQADTKVYLGPIA